MAKPTKREIAALAKRMHEIALQSPESLEFRGFSNYKPWPKLSARARRVYLFVAERLLKGGE